jgi:hypothetical protein
MMYFYNSICNKNVHLNKEIKLILIDSIHRTYPSVQHKNNRKTCISEYNDVLK